MNPHHNIIIGLLEELPPKHPKHSFKSYSSNYNDTYDGIDVHAKTGGRATMLITEEHGLRIIVDFDHRPVIDYTDPNMFEKIDTILNEILR